MKKFFLIILIVISFLFPYSVIADFNDNINEGEYYFGYGDSIIRATDYGDLSDDGNDCFVVKMANIFDDENYDHNIDGGGQSTTWGVNNFASHFDSGNTYFIFMFDASDEASSSKVTAQNMLWIYNHTLENGTTPILCIGALGGDYYSNQAEQEADNNAIIDACENYSIPYVKLFDAIDYDPWNGRMPTNYNNWINTSCYASENNVHPNKTGHIEMAEFLWFFINGSDKNITYNSGNDTYTVDCNYNQTIYIDMRNDWTYDNVTVHCITNNTDIGFRQGYNNTIHIDGLDGSSYLITNLDNNTPPNCNPIANFTYNTCENYTIIFIDNSTDQDGIVEGWLWDFGDGENSTDQHPIHVFPYDGIYMVCMEVWDNEGDSDRICKNITINSCSPIVNFHFSPIHPTTQDMVRFIDNSSNTGGTFVNWSWDFGDGFTSNDQHPIHQFNDDGTYNVSLIITDNIGAKSEIIKNVYIENFNPGKPIITYEPANPVRNETIHFTGGSQDLDGTIVRWQWTLGDGTSKNAKNFTHNYTQNGTYQILLTVTDDDGATNSTQMSIYVLPSPKSITTPQGQSETIITLHNLKIKLNTSNSTAFTINHYSKNIYNPERFDEIRIGINSLGHYYSITPENYTRINWPINLTLFYTSEQLNSSEISEYQLLGLYYYNTTSNEWVSYENTGKNTNYSGGGYDGYLWAEAMHLTDITSGADIQPPDQVTSLIITDKHSGKVKLSWDSAEDNTKVSHYKIYRDAQFLENTTQTTYTDEGLTNDQTYSYKIRAIDIVGNVGENSTEKQVTPTQESNNNGGTTPSGGGGFMPPLQEPNQLPTAKISGSANGFSDETLKFDGSESNDTDGTITKWEWNFGDNTTAQGEIVNHSYDQRGTYTITLTVTDDNLDTNNTSMTLIISQPNNPPTKPSITGSQTINISEDFIITIQSVDTDNDSIRYHIDWSDGSNTTVSDYLKNETTFTAQHSYDLAGNYTISCFSEDEAGAISQSQTYIIVVSGGNDETQQQETQQTPGFEIMMLFAAIFLAGLLREK